MKIPLMDVETSSMDEIFILGCHQWMEKCHLWMSSMDGEMSSMDDIHGWRQRMADMDRAFVKQLRIITKTFIQGNNMCPD